MFNDSLAQLEDDYDYSLIHGLAGKEGLSFVEWAQKIHDIKVTEDDSPLMYAMGVTSDEVPF